MLGNRPAIFDDEWFLPISLKPMAKLKASSWQSMGTSSCRDMPATGLPESRRLLTVPFVAGLTDNDAVYSSGLGTNFQRSMALIGSGGLQGTVSRW